MLILAKARKHPFEQKGLLLVLRMRKYQNLTYKKKDLKKGGGKLLFNQLSDKEKSYFIQSVSQINFGWNK